MHKYLSAAALAAALVIAVPAAAQQPAPSPGHIITVYRAAPGHQQQLLEWLARQDEISRAAGNPASQLYVHQNGADWDFLLVAPQLSEAQDAAFDAAAARMGVRTGPRMGIELRQHVAEHSDTHVAGPTTAADWLRRLGE